MDDPLTDSIQTEDARHKGVKSLIDFYFQSADGRMQEFVRTFNRVARTDMPVLIVGESGTGKELVAQALHQRSRRSEEPFLKIDCQLSRRALIETQLEDVQMRWPLSELAKSNAVGPTAANTPRPGTLFFQEISELSLELQAKVLPVLPNGDTELAWGAGEEKLRPRVLASTSCDLRQEVARGKFRQDLYFSLGGILLEIPPLRQRKDDLPALADHLLRKFARDLGRPDRPHLSPAALEILQSYDWPGNLPELSSVMKRIVFLGNAEAALAELVRDPSPAPAPPEEPQEKSPEKTGLKALAKEAAQRVEREMILQVLRERQWNRKRAASALNISYKTLLSKIKQLGLADEA